MSVDCKNFTCMICTDSNTDRLENTELLGHHDPGKKARKRAKWIHGICMSCIPTLETTQHLEICPLCNKESEIKKISVTPKGILRNIQSFDISKIQNDIKNKPFIENTQKNGKILGRYLAGFGLIIPFHLYGLHIFRRIALGL